MNIYIYNLSNTYNYGSMMMGENFIYYYNNLTKTKNNFYVETNNNDNIIRLREATGIKEIYSVEFDSLFNKDTSKLDYIFGFLGMKNPFSTFSKDINLVIVLGGDDFTEDYGWRGPIINAIKFYLLVKSGINVVMLGQTMGPYYSFRKPVMKNLLSKINKIYPRDPITFKYLQGLGLTNIKITDDLALLPLAKQEDIEKSKKYIAFFPSELIYRYSKEGNREDWINFNKFMIESVLEKYPSKNVVLLAHVLKPEHVDDRIIVNELYGLIKDKYGDRIILQNQVMYPYQVRTFIQQSQFVISSRMHPLISSIQCEVPIIALSYSTKYWGIIGERYELKDFILDIRYLSYSELKEKYLLLMETIENDFKAIQTKMSKKNKAVSRSIMETLFEISNLTKYKIM